MSTIIDTVPEPDQTELAVSVSLNGELYIRFPDARGTNLELWHWIRRTAVTLVEDLGYPNITYLSGCALVLDEFEGDTGETGLATPGILANQLRRSLNPPIAIRERLALPMTEVVVSSTGLQRLAPVDYIPISNGLFLHWDYYGIEITQQRRQQLKKQLAAEGFGQDSKLTAGEDYLFITFSSPDDLTEAARDLLLRLVMNLPRAYARGLTGYSNEL